MTVEVPERFFRPFQSAFPSEDTLSDPAVASLTFVKAGLNNLVEYSSLSTALRIESIGIPLELGTGAAALFAGASRFLASIGTMDSPQILPQDLIAGVDNMTAVLQAAGIFESIPIVAIVVKFITTGSSAAINAYGQSHTKAVEAAEMGYSKASDEDYTKAGMALHGGKDLTSMFVPINDASEGIQSFNVEVTTGWTGHKTHVRRIIYKPVGVETGGLGALPNTVQNPRAWQTNLDQRPIYQQWGGFKPAFSQSTMQSWQALLTNSRLTYTVDVTKAVNRWREWTYNMVMWATSDRYSDDMKERVAGMLMEARNALGSEASQTVRDAGYTHILPFDPVGGAGIRVSTTTGDFAIWALERQLLRRQRKYLGTMTVAYCSERDAAFDTDPELRSLLMSRRLLLLNHPDVVHVDLAQVVDLDFRAAVAVRKGPKGITDAPGAPPKGPGGLTGPSGALLADAPPVLGPEYASAMPMLGAGQEGSTGALGVLALLLMLGGR